MNKKFWIFFIVLLVVLFVLFFIFPKLFGNVVSYNKNVQIANVIQAESNPVVPVIPPLDIVAYNKKLNEIANNPIPNIVVPKKDKDGNEIPVPVAPAKPTLWPVKTVYPNAGAILPFNRIIAYYGNLYSTKMGVLGEYPEAEMLAR